MDWYKKMTLGQVLENAAEVFGERDALIFENERWTYQEFNKETNRVAKGLIALGVEPGERVAVWMTNRPEWLFLMFAIAKVGACIVPLNTRYRTDDVSYTVTQSRSTTLISLDRSGPINYQEMLQDSMPSIKNRKDGSLDVTNYPDLQRIVILGSTDLDLVTSWQDFLENGERVGDSELELRSATADPDAMMMIAYTSGTTGHPKGVIHSHIPIRNTKERTQSLGLTCMDVHMNYLPLFHIYAFSEISMACVLTGGCQVLMDVFDAHEVLRLAEQEKATILHGFEAHWLDLLNAQEIDKRQLSVRMGTLPSGVESTIPIAERVQDVFCPTITGFGMSETWAFVSMSNPSATREQRVNASGYPMNDYEFKVIDPDTREEKATGQPGELLIRGYAVTKGYWDKPEATKETIDSDGWLHSGDMGTVRSDGMIVFLGRYKDMLKVGGENVSPAEVEAYLRDMSEIMDAAVVAYPNERLGEIPVAYIIQRDGNDLTGDTIIARMKGRIASFKIPHHVFFVDSFPMTSSGKIRKIELRKDAKERLG